MFTQHTRINVENKYNCYFSQISFKYILITFTPPTLGQKLHIGEAPGTQFFSKRYVLETKIHQTRPAFEFQKYFSISDNVTLKSNPFHIIMP